MKASKLIVGAVLGVSAMSTAYAEWSANVGVSSSYVFRGLKLSDAQVFGGVDWEANNSGLYAGTWISNTSGVDDSTEVDLYFGYGFDLGGGIGLDLGFIGYYFPGSDELDSQQDAIEADEQSCLATGAAAAACEFDNASHGNNNEVYLGVGGNNWSATVWYNFGVDNRDDDELIYLEGNYEIPLHGQFSLGLHLGYTFLTGDAFDSVSRDDDQNGVVEELDIDDNGYLDYGVSLNAGDFFLSMTGTNLDDDHDLVEGGFFDDQNRPVFTVGWSKTWEGLGRK